VDVHVKTMFSRGFGKVAGVALMVTALTLALPQGAAAQAADDPNPGSLTFTGGLDILPGTAYVFRGITQETDPGLTLWPYGDIGLAMYSGDGTLKSLNVNFGVWNSLHTGSSGLDGPFEKLHYEEDFYLTFSTGFGGGFSLASTWTAYTSPNAMFGTTQELSFKASKAFWLNPYGLLAFELSGAADGNDTGTGSYLELGVAPTWPLMDGKASVAIPVKMGMSITNYYEDPVTGEESTFGFFDVGALATVPLGSQPGKFGSWNFHAGIDFLFFGDATETFNNGDASKVVGLFGIGVTY
jgi:hypothetical protein